MFALVAGSAVWSAHAWTTDMLDDQESLAVAWHEAQARAQEASHEDVQVVDVQENGGIVTVTARNNGTVVLDAARLDVLVDGVPVDRPFLRVEVGGIATEVWQPGEAIEIDVPGTAPSAVRIVTERGTPAAWRA